MLGRSLSTHGGGLGGAGHWSLGLRQPLGIPQVLLKEYSFDSRHKPAFTEEDVLNIFPVVKHVNPKASDAFHFFQSGQAKVQQGAWLGVARGRGIPWPGPDFATLGGALQAS